MAGGSRSPASPQQAGWLTAVSRGLSEIQTGAEVKMMRIVMGCLWMALALPVLASNEKLGPGDAVHITVFQQPDLTTDARVTEQGTVAMPLIGPVKVEGLTTGEAAAKIAE